MTGALWYLDQLKPLEAMRLLAESMATVDPDSAGRVQFQFQTGVFGALVTVMVPNEPIWEPLLRSFRESFGEPAPGPVPQASATFAEGLVRMLLDAPSQMAGPDEGFLEPAEYLVEGPELALDRARELFVRLEIHATAVQVSSAGGSYFFRIRDDQGRSSLFRGLWQGGELSDCRVFAGFALHGLAFYLPGQMVPDERVLDHFFALVNLFPGTFGLSVANRQSEDTRHHQPWLLLDREVVGDDEKVRLLDLSRLEFLDSFELSPVRASRITFESAHLQAQKQPLEALKRALDRAAPDLGYRLSLRTVRDSLNRDHERERLQEQIAELSYRLAYLDSMTRPRPVLWRFSPDHLVALAQVLRAFPMEVLLQDRLLYGFHATRENPAGYHFIMADPEEAVMEALDPLHLWEGREQAPLSFQLDPFWAAHYHHRESASLVFVPKGSTLEPALHDWDRHGMDQYLRRMVGNWFRGQPGIDQLPAKPLYLFEGRSHEQVRLMVLDLEQFQPLRLKLGWLNDNLLLAEQIGVETLMSTLADQLRRQHIAKTVAHRSVQTNRQFDEVAARTGEAVAETVAGLERALSGELNRVVEETFQTAGRVHELRETLRSWDLGEQEMREMLAKIKKKRIELLTQSEEARTKFGEMEGRIRKQLSASRHRRIQVLKDVSEEIQELREARARIKQDLFKLKFWE